MRDSQDQAAGHAPAGGHHTRRRLLAGACAVLALALSGAWFAADHSEPTARPAAAPDHVPDSGGEPVEVPSGGADGGEVPEGRTIGPFDVQYSAVGKLDERLLKAVQSAAEDARKDGVEFVVTSGWRSRKHQQRLLDEAVRKYGSLDKAREFVNTPDKSTHVSGKAVDIGPTDADDWLIRKGSAYGLCQVYANEMWHFELLTSAGGTCPALRSSAAG